MNVKRYFLGIAKNSTSVDAVIKMEHDGAAQCLYQALLQQSLGKVALNLLNNALKLSYYLSF